VIEVTAWEKEWRRKNLDAEGSRRARRRWLSTLRDGTRGATMRR
jgi:hypothetical protein